MVLNITNHSISNYESLFYYNLEKSTITYNNTSLTYYNTSTITDDTQSYWVNILNNTPDTSRKMELQGTYVNFFEINCIDEIIHSFDLIF